jgi:hypothetical protein
MKEEYGSGFDGTPEQALKYAQDTPGQELEVKRLVKIIRNKKMSKTLEIVKEVIKDKLLREQATSGWKTTVTKHPPTKPTTATEKANKNVGGRIVSKPKKLLPPLQNQIQIIQYHNNLQRDENIGGWIVTSQEAKKLKKLFPPPLPEQNPR